MVPPNQCGVYFDGFYPEEFGEWEFMMETSIKNITTTAIIETVEGPCDVILPGVPGRFILFTKYFYNMIFIRLSISIYIY